MPPRIAELSAHGCLPHIDPTAQYIDYLDAWLDAEIPFPDASAQRHWAFAGINETKFPLQLLDCAAQARLRYKEVRRRLIEGTVVSHLYRIMDMRNVHIAPFPPVLMFVSSKEDVCIFIS